MDWNSHYQSLYRDAAIIRPRNLDYYYHHVRAMQAMEAAPIVSPQPSTEGEDMIEVGKVVTRDSYSSDYISAPEQHASVSMTETSIRLNLEVEGPGSTSLAITPEQAIELGQLLLKAAEVQPEYAEEAKRLREENSKLNAKYKDLISGLGLDTEVDVLDARGTFVVADSKALG